MAIERFLSALWERQRSAGLTNAALADLIGVHEATISRLRRGERQQPHLTTLLAILRVYPDLKVFVSGKLPVRKPMIANAKQRGSTAP